ncbi:hypothetical protein [Bifidobacterium xylocopae]|uniref:Superfamily I DNA and RNA helicase n=1 Tax=Bifidobacterium xylocopae TaxID=2493119 RepID=A0A366KC96_9BIFI|nr:hypothetical protein [Bifidobacterium xylocopae]RBP99366.1 hypothetical protein CRD59_03960 [Bifidobacterium xylocopae]
MNTDGSTVAPGGGRSGRRRIHRRVVRQGTEHFEGDGLGEAGLASDEDQRSQTDKQSDDDRRILGELPPHWGLFPAEKG